jgi:hypothetical protein
MRDLSAEYGDWGAESPSSSSFNSGVMSTGSGAVGPRMGPIERSIASDACWVTVSFGFGFSDKWLASGIGIEKVTYLVCHL